MYLSVLCPCVLCFSPHVPSPWPNFSLMLIVPWFHLCFINYLVYSLVLKPCVSLAPASRVRHHSVSVSLRFCFIKVYVEHLLCFLVPLLQGNCDSIFMLQTQVCLLWFISEPAGLVQGFKVFFFSWRIKKKNCTEKNEYEKFFWSQGCWKSSQSFRTLINAKMSPYNCL